MGSLHVTHSGIGAGQANQCNVLPLGERSANDLENGLGGRSRLLVTRKVEGSFHPGKARDECRHLGTRPLGELLSAACGLQGILRPANSEQGPSPVGLTDSEEHIVAVFGAIAEIGELGLGIAELATIEHDPRRAPVGEFLL